MEEVAEGREDPGRDRAVEAEGGGLRGKIGLGMEGEGRTDDQGGEIRGEMGERAGYQVSRYGFGAEAGGGEGPGGEVEVDRLEGEAAGAERAADEGADAAGLGALFLLHPFQKLNYIPKK
ncbi:MAG: hypothetical protein NTV51_03000 [Verrucomicrobia bacterium]|nr:hypothetical protein [Verrucomicrobiota bacterium]